ncbi:MAG: hypothetical protein FWE75_09135 [Actinomycetia bacterium]|nr:hypothetical protein [Actinomycetes bacterium]
MRRTALASAGAAVLLALPSCASHTGDSDDSRRDYVTLMRRTTHGVHWQLDAWESDQGLCLAIDGPAGPSGPENTGAPGAQGSGACAFGAPTKKNPDNAWWFAGSEPGLPEGAATISYGPVPPQTARVQVATHLSVPAVLLPSGHHLPRARVWWALSTPGTAGGTPLAGPRAFTAAGHPVPLRPY